MYMLNITLLFFNMDLAQTSGVAEYTECISKKSDDEAPVVLELWRMRSTPSWPSIPGPLWPGVVSPERVLSIG